MKKWLRMTGLALTVVMVFSMTGTLSYGGTITEEDIRLLATTPQVENNVYYGGLYEPEAGIYFGASYEEDKNVDPGRDETKYSIEAINNEYPKKNSAYLMHLPFGDSIEDISEELEDADDAAVAIVLVWELETSYASMADYNDYIEDTAEYLRWLDVPVFLSFGSGVNMISGVKDSEYTANFKYVSDLVRDVASDIALVWTMDAASRGNINNYYPGDAYVDWIGINVFLRPDRDLLTEAGLIAAGYGSDKPVMLTEAGVARYDTNGRASLDDWGSDALGQLMSYLPAQYPQIKGIFMKNGAYSGDGWHNYDLYGSRNIVSAYNTINKGEMFLSDVKQSGTYRYAEVGSRKDPSVVVEESSVQLRVMIDSDDLSVYSVDYKLDGKSLGKLYDAPYKQNLSIKGMSDEKHELDIYVYEDGDLLFTKPYVVVHRDEVGVIEEGDFQVIDFKDVRGQWSESYIIEVSKRGIVVGSEGFYRPNDYITRAEVASVLSKLGGLPQDQAVDYKDIAGWEWYTKYISGAQDYMIGFGSYYFPTRQASREEIITALVKLKGYNVSGITADDREDFNEAFYDEHMVNPEYLDYMVLAVKYEIVGGYEDGTLKPQNSMKRGELAKVLYTTFYQ